MQAMSAYLLESFLSEIVSLIRASFLVCFSTLPAPESLLQKKFCFTLNSKCYYSGKYDFQPVDGTTIFITLFLKLSALFS